MPHKRDRNLLPILLKRIKLLPILGVVGARQSGKSVLLRDLLNPRIHGQYVTLDSKTSRSRAQRAPDAFARPLTRGSLIIDEIQKVPDLFDSMKYHVDKSRRPGMYLVSGSTEFSKATGIRESLTGRIGLLRLYPMILSEIYAVDSGGHFLKPVLTNAKITLDQFEKKVDRGGMPGICFLRSEDEFQQMIQMWLEATCFRDLARVSSGKIDGELAMEILAAVAVEDEPTASNIAKRCHKDRRIVQRYLRAFQRIFVIHELKPHPAGVGKQEYLLFDSGIARYLGASRHSQIRAHLLNEVLATLEYSGIRRPTAGYYRNEKTSRIPIVLNWPVTSERFKTMALKFYDGEDPSKGDFAALDGFQTRVKEPIRMLLLTHAEEAYQEGNVLVAPLRG